MDTSIITQFFQMLIQAGSTMLVLLVIALAVSPFILGTYGFFRGYANAKRQQDVEKPLVQALTVGLMWFGGALFIAVPALYYLNDKVFQGQLLNAIISVVTQALK